MCRKLGLRDDNIVPRVLCCLGRFTKSGVCRNLCLRDDINESRGFRLCQKVSTSRSFVRTVSSPGSPGMRRSHCGDDVIFCLSCIWLERAMTWNDLRGTCRAVAAIMSRAAVNLCATDRRHSSRNSDGRLCADWIETRNVG